MLSIATLRLVDQGSLALDDTLPGEPFTTRQLLRHESGLGDYGDLARYHADVAAGAAPWPVGYLLRAVDATSLRYRPGEGWAYSNVGYLRVAQLIERISERKLPVALAQLVFGPAGLTNARLAAVPEDLADVQMGGATGYHPGWVYHGLVCGTVGDAACLLSRLVEGHLLKPATLAAMKSSRPLPQYRQPGQPEPGYGLGLMLAANDPEAHLLGHGGEGPGSAIAVYAKGRHVAAAWTALPAKRDATARVQEMPP